MRSKALTWDEVADLYQKHYGGIARILPMKKVFKAVSKLDCIVKDKKEGTLHLREGGQDD